MADFANRRQTCCIGLPSHSCILERKLVNAKPGYERNFGQLPREMAHVTFKPEAYYRVACWRLRKLDMDILARIAPRHLARSSISRFEKTKRQIVRSGTALVSENRQSVHYRGKTVHIHYYGNTQAPKILILHGWNGCAAMLAGLAGSLAQGGYQVVVPDMPGHGASAGDQYSFYDLGLACRDLFASTGEFHAVIGHSAGGLISIMAIASGLKTRHLVTIGSPASLSTLLASYVKITQTPETSLPRIHKEYTRRYGISPSEFSAGLISHERIRTLIVHEQMDWQVGINNAYAILQKSYDGQIFMTRGCTHINLISNTAVMDKIKLFLDEGIQRAEHH